MAKNCSDFAKMYDDMKSGKSNPTSASEKLKLIKESKDVNGKLNNFSESRDAYDKVMNPNSEKKVINESGTKQYSKDQKLRMLGAIQVIRERLEEKVSTENVDGVINMIKEVVSSI